jgi:hypothetical protein
MAEPNLKIQMDFYHAQMVEGDLLRTFKRYFNHIAHIQIAGVPDRHEPDEGEVNYSYILRMLDEMRYTGWIGCEYRRRRGAEEGLRWMDSFVSTSVQQQLPQRPARFDELGRLRLFDRLTLRASGFATIAVVRFEFP